MKLAVLIFILYLSVFVESGVILDNIKTGFSKTGQAVTCGVHKIGGLILRRENVDCESSQVENHHEDNTQNRVTKKDDNPTNDQIAKVDHKNEKPLNVVPTSTTPTVVTVPEGKRLIGVGANCPEGYRGDGKGNCREEY